MSERELPALRMVILKLVFEIIDVNRSKLLFCDILKAQDPVRPVSL